MAVQSTNRIGWLGWVLLIGVGLGLGVFGYSLMLARLVVMLVFFGLVSYRIMRWLAYGSWGWQDWAARLERWYARVTTSNQLSGQRLEYLRDLHRRGDG